MLLNKRVFLLVKLFLFLFCTKAFAHGLDGEGFVYFFVFFVTVPSYILFSTLLSIGVSIFSKNKKTCLIDFFLPGFGLKKLKIKHWWLSLIYWILYVVVINFILLKFGYGLWIVKLCTKIELTITFSAAIIISSFLFVLPLILGQIMHIFFFRYKSKSLN